MTESWVKEFYKKQFEWLNYDIDMENWFHPIAKDVQEQVGYPIQTMLELGAGNDGFDFEKWQFKGRAFLHECLSYRIKVKKLNNK